MRNSKTDQTVVGMDILFLSSFSKSSAIIHQGVMKRPDNDERHSTHLPTSHHHRRRHQHFQHQKTHHRRRLDQ